MNLKKIGILSGGTLILLLLLFINPFRLFDRFFYDLNFDFAASPVSDTVCIVGIDSKSIQEIGGWKWDRSTLADLFAKIESGRPRAVALDFLFPRTSDKTGNDSLSQVLRRMNNLVMAFEATSFGREKKLNINQATQLALKHRIKLLKNKEQLAHNFFYSAEDLLISDTAFVKSAARMGFVNISTDQRSQNLLETIHVLKLGPEFVPSFGVAAVATFLGLRDNQLILDGTSKIHLGKRTVPLTTYAASTFLNYRGPRGTIKTYSASDIINGNVSSSRLRNKLVFVGITAPGIIDFLVTPVDSHFPGVEAWATAATDILQKKWVTYGGGLPGIFNILLALLLFPGLALLVPPSKKWITFVIMSLGVLGSIALCFVLFSSNQYFWNPGFQIYAALFLLVYLAIQKADPTLVAAEAITLEPPEGDELDLLPPPQNKDFLNVVPKTATSAFILNQLGTTVIPNKRSEEYAETVSGTVIEQSIADARLKIHAQDNVEEVFNVPQDSIDEFRKLCGGTILRLLGSGGMADVYLIWNPRLEVYRAVKVLKPGQHSSILSRFETEIRIFSKLSHDNIVRCYSVNDWHSLPCVEMEYINGASFEDLLSRRPSFNGIITTVVGILVCRALSYAHRQVITIYGETYKGVIHRDIKPANILMSRSGRIKLTDFGIARPTTVSLHTMDTGNVVGTMPYLATEQLDGGDITARADIYALGATLYEFLCGQRAFPQQDITALVKAKTMGEYAPLEPSETVPKNLIQCIDKAMAINPNERYQSAEEFGKDLEKVYRSLIKDNGYTHLRQLADEYWS